MAITDLLASVREAKAAASALVAEDKFQSLTKATQFWVKSWPAQEQGLEWLRASGIYDVCPRQFVLNYWRPKGGRTHDIESLIKMSTGTHLHWILQNQILGPMGCLYGNWITKDEDTHPKVIRGFHPEPLRAVHLIASQKPLEWIYAEDQVEDAKYRIKGHTDGILDLDRVQFVFNNLVMAKKKPMELMAALHDLPPGERCLLEIKTLGSYGFKQMKTAADIPDYYKNQASIYQNLTGIHTTLFWLIDRDTVEVKTLVYKYEPRWWRESARKARIIWTSIRDRTLPDSMMKCILPSDIRAKKCPHGDACWLKLDFDKYVKDNIAIGEASGRKFLDLSGLSFDE